MVKRGELYVVSAPSGAGKTTLVHSLVENCPGIEISISHTTRVKRENEKAGYDYHFVTQSEFKKMLTDELFLESAQVFGNFYGTAKDWVEEKRQAGIDVVLEIDWQGARQVRTKFPETISIFILPPNQETLSQRLVKRHQDNLSIIEARMKEARQELSHYIEYDYLICNDVFEQAVQDLQYIVMSKRLRLAHQRIALKDLIVNLTN